MYNKSSDTITHSIGYQHVYNGPGEGGGGGKTPQGNDWVRQKVTSGGKDIKKKVVKMKETQL